MVDPERYGYLALLVTTKSKEDVQRGGGNMEILGDKIEG